MRLVASDEWRALPAEAFAKAGGVQREGLVKGEWRVGLGKRQVTSGEWGAASRVRRMGCKLRDEEFHILTKVPEKKKASNNNVRLNN